MPYTVTSVGQVIPHIKGSMQLPPGWKYMDVSNSFYDLEHRQKSSFVMRWLFDSSKRWESFKVPQPGAVTALSGMLLGRVGSDHSEAEQILVCLIQTIDVVSWGNSGASGVKTPGSSGKRPIKGNISVFKRLKGGESGTIAKIPTIFTNLPSQFLSQGPSASTQSSTSHSLPPPSQSSPPLDFLSSSQAQLEEHSQTQTHRRLFTSKGRKSKSSSVILDESVSSASDDNGGEGVANDAENS